MALNDYILAQGVEARKKNEEKRPQRSKTNYVRLKDGESMRGFLLTTDFVCYLAHSDFNKGIKTHTCRDPKHGKDCLSCQHDVKRSKKTIVPFYNIDTKQTEVFDASPTAMKAVYAFVDQYEEESTTTAVSLSRSGSDTSTTYTIMPVRIKAAERDLFVVPEGTVITEDFILNVLNIPDDEYVRGLLGLPAADAEIKPINESGNVSDEDLPF